MEAAIFNSPVGAVVDPPVVEGVLAELDEVGSVALLVAVPPALVEEPAVVGVAAVVATADVDAAVEDEVLLPLLLHALAAAVIASSATSAPVR